MCIRDRSHVAVNVNDESSAANVVTETSVVVKQIPGVVYFTEISVSFSAPVTVPVLISILIPGPGAVSNPNSPPGVARLETIAPSHVGVSVNDGSSYSK